MKTKKSHLKLFIRHAKTPVAYTNILMDQRILSKDKAEYEKEVAGKSTG